MILLRIDRFPVATLVAVLLWGGTAEADISLPGVFSDRMVLQHGDTVRIWGTSEPNEELQITLDQTSVTTTADAAGTWTAFVTPPAPGGPYELVVAGSDARVVISDVLVGEVWLCSGQSNMQWSVTQSSALTDDAELEKYLSSLVDARLRLLTVPSQAIEEPSDNFAEAATWQVASPEVIAEFSATAFYFARALRDSERLKDVPIGLIDCSWGGTPGEAWVSRSALDQQEVLAPLLNHWDENTDQPRSPHRPGNLFNGMISPLIPFNFRGVIWYQGEANVGRGHQYATILQTLINDWRDRFEQGMIPFYMVQLAPHRYGRKDPQDLPEVWEAQLQALDLPNVAIAATSDIGNPDDIHPKNKQIVGHRLALIARAQTYGESDQIWSGPQFDSMERVIDTNRMAVQFAFAGELCCPSSSPDGFLICGKDQQFVPAQAKIEQGRVMVWSDDVPEPVAIRYLWNDTAAGNLFNGAGLPALPFRTDTFELLSKDQHF